MLNDHKNTTYQNMQNSVKAVLGDRQQFIAPNEHVKREESLKTHYVRIHFKKLGVGGKPA